MLTQLTGIQTSEVKTNAPGSEREKMINILLWFPDPSKKYAYNVM